MVLNYIFVAFFLIAFVVGAMRLCFMGDTTVFPAMIDATFDSSKTAFEISLGLTGVLSLWLGIMKIGEKGGVVNVLARLLSPVFVRLFPDIPKGHPVTGTIFMNIAANMLGLDNAATPMGLKAMKELKELEDPTPPLPYRGGSDMSVDENPYPSPSPRGGSDMTVDEGQETPSNNTPSTTNTSLPPIQGRDGEGSASNSMIMFLVLNTSGLTLIPVSIMVYRAQMGAQNPTDIFVPILLATFFSTMAGILVTSIYQRINLLNRTIVTAFGSMCLFVAALIWGVTQLPKDMVDTVSTTVANILLMTVITGFILAGVRKKVNVYEAFVEGAKEGFQTAVRIIPYLVAILVGIGVFRASGAMDWLIHGIAWLIGLTGIDTDFVGALPTALMKPLSGSGARGMMVDAMKQYGADSFVGRLSCIFQGSTDTTFYVLAVYFGSVGIRNTRHAVQCGLLADLAGVIAAIAIAYLFF